VKASQIDIVRFLPEAMRKGAVARPFSYVSLALWVITAAGLMLVGRHAFVSIVSVHGSESFELGTMPREGRASALAQAGKVVPLKRDGEQLRLVDAAGQTWTATSGEEGVRIQRAGQFAYRFKVREEGDGYALHGEDDALLYRVKFEDEKFNIYDAAGARIRHGKRKHDEVVVRDDAGRELLTITGAQLKDSAMLSLPIPAEPKALGWALQRPRLLP
jgi:hypothetical protein